MALSATVQRTIESSARAIALADALVITAGAGIGVDSGLPDFRGTEGFWEAYQPFAKLGLRFDELASPIWFRQDPALAWGFYGHRRNLYRETVPHMGFGILKGWVDRAPGGAFVCTSNVDGHFQKAGNAIPTVRRLGEALQRHHSATLIRINPRESEGPTGTLSLPMGALDAIQILLQQTKNS